MIPINFMDRTPNLINYWKGEPRMGEGSWYITDQSLRSELGMEARLDFRLTYIGPCPNEASRRLQRLIRQMNYGGSDVQMYKIPYNMLREHYLNVDVRERIEKVIFNDPATIIIWKDEKKTVVKAGEGEKYDPEKGFAMAIAKYALGNEGNYYETFKKWLPKDEPEAGGMTLDEALSWFATKMNPPEEEKEENL